MTSIIIPQRRRPSYATGYARTIAEARYPQLWRGCVGAWSAGLGPQGYTLQDQSGNANHGALTNYTVPPDYSDGLAFDGTDDYVNLGTLDISSFNAISWGLWVKTTTASTRAFSISHTGADDIRVWVDSTISHVAIDDGTAFLAEFSNSVLNGQWHQVYGVFDGTTVVSYFDGTLSNSTGGASFNFATADGLAAIGKSGYYFNGQIDDVRIYNRALPPSEIQLLASQRNVSYSLAPRYYALPGEEAATETRQSLTLLGVG